MGFLKWFFAPELNQTMLRQVGEDPAGEAQAGAGETAGPPLRPVRKGSADDTQAPVEDGVRYPVEFTAVTGEYFRIWIVNLALTLVTLGIYSAWAKVRKRRYLYGHTRIAGEGFEY